jgi:hypothetical protein
VADDLERQLEDRLAQDAERIKFTPAERAEKRNRKLRDQQRRNFQKLGFGDRFSE